jgi:maltose-binding protein MalE
MRTASWAMAAVLAIAPLVGCEKSSETMKGQSEKANTEAEKKTTQAASQADQTAREAREKAERERNDLHATVMREKVDYRAKLHEAIDQNEKQLADQKVDVKQVKRGDRSKDAALLGTRPAPEAAQIKITIERRDRLMDLTDEIDKTQDQDWPALKRRIERELKDLVKPFRPGRI